MKFSLLITLAVLGFLTVFLALPLSSADLFYEANQDINLKIPCTVEGSPCSTSALCNLSIQYPGNASYLINSQKMTNLNNGDFNYTLVFYEVGDYYTKVSCKDGVENGTAIFYIKVRRTGEEISTAGGIVYGISFVLLLFFFLISLYGYTKISWKHSRDTEGKIISVNDFRYVKVVLLFLSWLFILFMSGLAKSMVQNYLAFSGIDSAFNLIWSIFLALTFPLAILSIVVAIFLFIDSKRINKIIKRGLPLR